MATTEAKLNQLYNRASTVLGPAEAETMMEAMRSGLRGDVATSAEVQDVRSGLRGEMQELNTGLRGEMQELNTDLRGEMQQLSTDLRGEMHAMEQRMTKTFVTWMLASQAAFTTVVAVFFTLAT